MQLNAQAKRVLGAIALLMLGIPLFLIGTVYNIGSVIFHSHASMASGTIEYVRRDVVNTHRFYGVTYQYNVTFWVDKQKYECSTSDGNSYESGTTVNVLYDPDDLKSCEIADGGRETFFNEFTFIPGLILLIIAGGLIIFTRQAILAEDL